MNYKIISPIATDVKDTLIEKEGVVVTFTLNQVEAHIKQLEQAKKELEAKGEYEAARITNVSENHPKVLELEGEELMAAYILQEATSMKKAVDAKLEEINTQLADYAAEVEEILEQVPELVVPTIVEQAEAVLEAAEPVEPTDEPTDE
jgi:uncharacterized phage infection (PIP) family protein YhgE